MTRATRDEWPHLGSRRGRSPAPRELMMISQSNPEVQTGPDSIPLPQGNGSTAVTCAIRLSRGTIHLHLRVTMRLAQLRYVVLYFICHSVVKEFLFLYGISRYLAPLGRYI